MRDLEFEEDIESSNSFHINRSNQEDVLDDLYRIEVMQIVGELYSDFCKYYNAVNLEDDSEYFAIVFEKHYNPPINLLHTLKTFNFNGLNNLITYGAVKLSHLKEYRLVAIVPKYNIAANFANYIQKNGPFSTDQIEKKLIPTFAEILSQCEKLNVNCGNINPNNIIVREDGGFLLREFFITYQNFDQAAYFLAPELAECIEYGRITKGVAADIYAFGVIALQALIGKQPWSNYDNVAQYNHERFDQTSYKLLVGKRKIAEHFKTFFKWMLHDNSSLRWKARNIFEWISGSHGRGYSVDRIVDNSNLIAFNNQNYATLKSLSYALYNNWEDALKFIQEDKLIKWAQRQQVSPDIIEGIEEILGKDSISKAILKANTSENNNKLTRLLSVIDPGGGIRQNGYAISIESIPSALHYLLTRGRSSAVDQIISIIREKYWKVSESKNSGSHTDTETDVMLDELYKLYAPSSPSGGLEMIVYWLNPQAICLSALVSNDYVDNIADLLKALDKIAANNPEKFAIDRHIIAFISAKIGLKQDAGIKLLRNFPKFSDHPLIYGLSLLSIASGGEPDIKLPNVCAVLVDKILELFDDHLHNVKFKKQLDAKLRELSERGELSPIVSILSDQSPFIADYNGYYNACREVQNIKAYVQTLGAHDKYSSDALVLGQKITVLVSYILCLIVTVILMV